MKKNTSLCVDLKTNLQDDPTPQIGTCYNGILTRTDDEHFLFEEAVKMERRIFHRNPKLYEGKHVSLVRMQNGKYSCHLRTINNLETTDRNELAFNIYSEVLAALECIQ